MPSESSDHATQRGLRHHGKQICEDCGELFDPTTHPRRDRDDICVRCEIVRRDTEALGHHPFDEVECAVCGDIIDFDAALSARHEHIWNNLQNNNKGVEYVDVCSVKCKTQIERVGYARSNADTEQ